MQVKILHAESLRFPGEGKSAQGQSEAKTRPKGVVDAQQVNIPAPAVEVEARMQSFKADPPIRRGGGCRCKPVARGRFVAEVHGGWAEKSARGTIQPPVLKLTQVGEESILRRSRELRLRN